MVWSTSDTTLKRLHCCSPQILSRPYRRRCSNDLWQSFTTNMVPVPCCLIRLQLFLYPKLERWHDLHSSNGWRRIYEPSASARAVGRISQDLSRRSKPGARSDHSARLHAYWLATSATQ